MKTKTVQTMVAILLVATMLAPLTAVSGEQNNGITRTYGPLGQTGTDADYAFPEMNTTTFPLFVSDNAMKIENNGDTNIEWTVFQFEPLQGTQHAYPMSYNYTIQVYNHVGALVHETPAVDNGLAYVEWTIPRTGPSKVVYFKMHIHPEIAYEIDNYSLNYTVSMHNTAPTAAQTRSYQDTVTGTTTLNVGYVMTLGISYTGTQPDYVYFTQPAGLAQTVPSTNNLRITNTGNAAITALRIDTTGKQWATGYALPGNTNARLTTEATPQTLNPSYTWTFASGIWPGGTIREWTFTMLNNQLGEGTWNTNVDIRATNTALGLQADATASMRYTGYAGDLNMAMTYSTGTSLVFPEVTPGDTNIQTSNHAILTNQLSSDYTVDTLEFLFAPLTKGTDHITFANNADVIINDAYTIPLVSYTSGGIVYGRALVNLGSAPQPPPIAPGQQMTFKVRLYQVSSSTPPGSYSGNFLVTASANPIAFFSGTIQFSDSLLDIQLLEYALSITNTTGGTTYHANQPITLDFTVSTPTGMLEIPVGAYVWRIYAENGTLMDEILWDNITYTSINTTTYAPAATPKTYTFTEPGNYTIGLVPLLSTGPLDDLETSADITIYPEISMTPGTSMGIPLLLLVLAAGAILVLLVLLFIRKEQ